MDKDINFKSGMRTLPCGLCESVGFVEAAMMVISRSLRSKDYLSISQNCMYLSSYINLMKLWDVTWEDLMN